MKHKTKLNIDKSNNRINIPKMFIENLGWKNKEKIEIEYKNNELIIRRCKNA